MVKNPAASAGDIREVGLIPGSGRSPGGGHGHRLYYSCRGESHGHRSLVGYSSWGHKELDMTEHTLSLEIISINLYAQCPAYII